MFLLIPIIESIYLFNNATSIMWHKVNFKKSTAGLNLELYFSDTGYLTRLKYPVCCTIYSLLVEKEMDSRLSRGH